MTQLLQASRLIRRRQREERSETSEMNGKGERSQGAAEEEVEYSGGVGVDICELWHEGF